MCIQMEKKQIHFSTQMIYFLFHKVKPDCKIASITFSRSAQVGTWKSTCKRLK